MQLFALPLARKPLVNQATPLFYLHAQKLASSKSQPERSGIAKLAAKAIDKAADTWSGFGSAKDGSWKRKIYVTGDRFMDRIEFEEWSLKAIDPALAPRAWDSVNAETDEQAFKNKGSKPLERISLMFPPSLLSPGPLRDALVAQIAHREPHHKSAMIKCLAAAPLTIPFAIIPLIPNFPLFYVLWRAWSHWRAWKSSQYLASLLTTSQIQFVPSPELDKIYNAAAASKSTSDLLLTLEKVPQLVKAFSMSEDEGNALRRGVVQAEMRLAKLQATTVEEAQKVEKDKTKEDVNKVKDA